MMDARPDPVDPGVLDRFTRLAAQVLDVPVVCVSLVDEQRRRVVGSHPRSVRAVPDGEMAHGAPRNGQLAVRAAIELVTSDSRQVGTLTVMDWRPHHWSAPQLEFLKELSLRLVCQVDIGPAERVM